MDPEDGPPVVAKDSKDKETVKVVLRCRPFNSKETSEGRMSIITIDTQAGSVGIRCPDNDQIKSFTFDAAYDETTTQRQFYDESGYPLVESVFEGYNGTIFAYGQTGCGKTHTMQGRDQPPELRGVIPLSFDHIFDNIRADTTKEYMVRASYLEIYNEEIRDLLGDDQKKKLDLKEGTDGAVYVKDLIEVVVHDVNSINRVMSKGFKNRTVGATLMNEGSSRSHSIFTVVVEMSEKLGGRDHFKAGKLNLVDLAGSERQSKTGATGNRLKEGCKINLSLSALGNVISALVDGKGKHIPYRDSKLTRLLQDSLGGNTKTLMVAAISPADYNYDETLSTLRYANRAKNIKNKPIVNEDPKDTKLREYKEEIERLKKLLDVQSRGASSLSGTLSGVATPTRPLTAVDVVDSRVGSAAVLEAQEREAIARAQREASEMMATAQSMMEEARALQQQQQQQQQQQLEQQDQDKEKDEPQAGTPREDVGVTPVTEAAVLKPQPPAVARVLSSDALASPKPGSAGRLLPPIGSTPTSPRAEPPAPSAPTPRASVLVDESAVAKALQDAAQIDAQAKAMMARAEQLMREAEQRKPQVEIVKEVVMKEVIPEHHLQAHANVLSQKETMGQELQRAQLAVESQMKEKEALHMRLQKITSQILSHSSKDEDTEIALLKQQVEHRRTQLKLKEKARKEAQLAATQRALEVEKQHIQEELKSAQEAAQASVASAKKKEVKFKAKLEAARQEVLDLTAEFERERENLLDTIREQTKESKLLEQLVEVFLPQNELVKVWERAVWSDEREAWVLPKMKPRSDFQKLKLPSLGGGGEEGGAEVISDEEGDDGGDGASTTGAPSVRSVTASSGGKRSKTTSSARADAGGGFYSARIEDIGGPLTSSQQNQSSLPTHRLLSPATTRLPSAMRPPQGSPLEPQQDQDIHPKQSKSSKEKRRKSSKSGDKASSSSSASPSASTIKYPLVPYESFPLDGDQLAPLQADGYQPRDRLQSRQGSRQGQRSVSTNSSSRVSLGEFEPPPPSSSSAELPMFPLDKPPIASRGSGTGSRGSGVRKHSHPHPHHRPPRDHHAENDALVVEPPVEEHSPDASLQKKTKHKHKKKKDKAKDKGGDDHDENDLLRDLGDGFFLPRAPTSRSPPASAENQDR